MRNCFTFGLLVVLSLKSVAAFVQPLPRQHQQQQPIQQQVQYPNNNGYLPPSLSRQRQSVASIQLRGIFGLGAPEVAVIMVAAAFLLGPEKLAEFGKDAGRIAGELKEVPKEFQEGLKEGEAAAMAMKEKKPVQDATVVSEESTKKE